MQQVPAWWQLMRQKFPRRQFVMGALAPIALFYTWKRLGQPLTGAWLASIWGLCVVSIDYWRSRRVNVFAALAVTLAVIELAATVITRSPTWYLAAAAMESGVLGGVSSLAWHCASPIWCIACAAPRSSSAQCCPR